jgi:LmbE family N-acetylglucosaminyl deacetylase
MQASTNEPRSLLAVFARPDDEAFGTGGTLSHYARQGVRVGLVCATRGELGEISDPSLATPETLPQVRENELRCAAETLGISDLIFLGYRDSGMEGTAPNKHPDSYMNADADEVVGKLVCIIRELRPQVVLTFEPNGGYGHPDHKAIHRHTVAAVAAAGDGTQYPDQGAPWQPSRLFFTAIPRSVFAEMRDRMREHGIDTTQFDQFEANSWPDEEVHLTLDVSAEADRKWRSFLCHRTQFGTDMIFFKLPEDEIKQIMGKEHFALGWPEPAPDLKMHDFFE